MYKSFRLRFPAPWRHSATIVGLTAALGACAVGPDFVPPAAPDDSSYATKTVEVTGPDGTEGKQHLTAGDKVSGDWWALFHSKQLDQVLQQTIADNRSLAAAKATLSQAQELVNQVAGQRYPQLNFAGNGVRQRTNLAGSDADFKGPTYDVVSIGPTLSFALDPFGLLGAAGRTAGSLGGAAGLPAQRRLSVVDRKRRGPGHPDRRNPGPDQGDRGDHRAGRNQQ